MSTLRKVLHEYRFHVWSSELRRPVMNANKTWRAKWFELVLKVTDPRFYSMAAADNQRIQKWSGMRWLMIDDTNIRNTLQCKFQLNILLRLSFFFSYWCILLQIIRASFVEWLQSFDSAVLRSRLPSHTLQRCGPTTDSAWDVPSELQCFATVGSRSFLILRDAMPLSKDSKAFFIDVLQDIF